jgi:8-oxo-dGTP diphosphatase
MAGADMTTSEQDYEVRAAGGVVFRESAENHSDEASIHLVLVHRPRYDDWTFPKGKAEVGETDEQTALREVLEETGLICELGEELPCVTYRDHKDRSKIVRYWMMTVRSGSFDANDEVDLLEWVSPTEAGERLTYDHDVDLLAAFLTLRANG